MRFTRKAMSRCRFTTRCAAPDLKEASRLVIVAAECSEIEQHLRKNNSKTAYQLVKDLTNVKQGKATIVQDRSGKCLTEIGQENAPQSGRY